MKDKFIAILNGHQKILIAVILFAMAVFGFAVSGGYGTPLDEDIEVSILTSNIKEYAMHIPGALGDKLENKFSYVTPISQSEEKDHGIAAYYPYAPLHILAGSHKLQRNLWHAYTFVIFMAGVLAVYGIVKVLFGSSWQALFASLMLYLSPRMFAEGHYNNKDMVLMSFALLTVYFGIKMIQTSRYSFAVLFAIAAAVAANTKIAGAWFFGIVGISYLVWLYVKKELKKANVAVGICAIIVFFAAYAALTPAMWGNPLEFIKTLLMYAQDFDRWDNNILFEGSIYKYSINPPPKYYLLKMILITTPPYLLALTAVGTVLTAVELVKAKFRNETAVIMAVNVLLWLFPLTFAVLSGTRVYNGWRHFYFIYGPMVITASYGVNGIVNLLKKRFAEYAGLTAAAAGIITVIVMLTGIVINHPYQCAYFNIFAGSDVKDNYETDYWMVSTKSALNRLYSDSSVKLPMKISGSDRMTQNALRKALKVLPDEAGAAYELCDMADAGYIFVNHYGPVLTGEDTSQWEDNLKILSINSYGVEIAAVYKVKQP